MFSNIWRVPLSYPWGTPQPSPSFVPLTTFLHFERTSASVRIHSPRWPRGTTPCYVATVCGNEPTCHLHFLRILSLCSHHRRMLQCSSGPNVALPTGPSGHNCPARRRLRCSEILWEINSLLCGNVEGDVFFFRTNFLGTVLSGVS